MKALYDTQAKKVLPYNRADDEPVVGLEAHLIVMDVVESNTENPNEDTHTLERFESVNLDTRRVTRGARPRSLLPEELEGRAKQKDIRARDKRAKELLEKLENNTSSRNEEREVLAALVRRLID